MTPKMVHFLFYAGKAYKIKRDGGGDAIGQAVQFGFLQERMDGERSKYSYEDLPTDRQGAIFGAREFDETSCTTLGEQIETYLNSIGATNPSAAPNWTYMPITDNLPRPLWLNMTTSPMLAFTAPAPPSPPSGGGKPLGGHPVPKPPTPSF